MWFVICRSVWRTAKAVDLKFILSTKHNRKSHWARDPKKTQYLRNTPVIIAQNLENISDAIETQLMFTEWSIYHKHM